jgi:hypothetical protein
MASRRRDDDADDDEEDDEGEEDGWNAYSAVAPSLVSLTGAVSPQTVPV